MPTLSRRSAEIIDLDDRRAFTTIDLEFVEDLGRAISDYPDADSWLDRLDDDPYPELMTEVDGDGEGADLDDDLYVYTGETDIEFDESWRADLDAACRANPLAARWVADVIYNFTGRNRQIEERAQ